jgi:tetratricopeptide (TPR) repeat protein
MPLRYFTSKYLYLCLICALLSTACSQQNKPTTDETTANVVEKADEILSGLNEKIKTDPNNAALYNQRALHYMYINSDDQALSDIERSIKLNPENDNWYVTKANVLFKMNKVKECKENLEKAISLNAENVQAHNQLAEIHIYLEDYDNAMKHADLSVKADVYNAHAYYLKGLIFNYMKDTVKAVSSLQTCIEQDPEYYDAYAMLGILFAVKNHPLAEQYYDNALKIRPQSIEALYNKAMYYQELDRGEEAIELYNRILEIDASYYIAHYNTGYVLLTQYEDFKEAITHFTKAIQLEPKYVEAYYNRGLCYEQLKDLAAAEAEYRKALSLMPTFTLAAKALGRVRGDS